MAEAGPIKVEVKVEADTLARPLVEGFYVSDQSKFVVALLTMDFAEGGRRLFLGVSACDDHDVFDLQIGERIATGRALRSAGRAVYRQGLRLLRQQEIARRKQSIDKLIAEADRLDREADLIAEAEPRSE